MPQSGALTTDELEQPRVICDDICERLKTDDEYTYYLDERRGKAGGFPDAVWGQALGMLRAVG